MTTRITARFNSQSKCGEPFPKTPTFKFLKTGAENRPMTQSSACWTPITTALFPIEEKARARIILFGHSWGASAAVLLARDLRREGVPVLLTVQVDSVAKAWQNDSVIPDNVAEAVNFYQPHGIVHGRTRITAADPAKTEILGNYRTDYKKNPVVCQDYSWADRFFTPGHMQSECDPHVWSQIENLVRQRLSPPTTAATVSPQP